MPSARLSVECGLRNQGNADSVAQMAIQPANRYQRFQKKWECPTTGRTFSVKFDINTDLADAIESRFGLPAHMLTSNGVRISSPSDVTLLASRGISIQGNILSVDYKGIAEQAKGTLLPLARHLVAQCGANAEMRAKVAAIVGLAQVTAYELPDDGPDGTGKLGFRTPLALLARGAGDCDSKVCLAASMLKAVGLASVAIVYGRNHALLGVEIAKRSGDASIVYEKSTYVVTEVTMLAPIGKCHPDEIKFGSSYRALAI